MIVSAPKLVIHVSCGFPRTKHRQRQISAEGREQQQIAISRRLSFLPERRRHGTSGRHHGSRNEPRYSGPRPSRGRDLAAESTAIPPDRRIRRIFRGIPRGSVTLQAPDGASFLAPANADFKAAYRSAAGHWNSWTAKAPIKAAVGHWGTYDFQRRGDIFIPRYPTHPIMPLASSWQVPDTRSKKPSVSPAALPL